MKYNSLNKRSQVSIVTILLIILVVIIAIIILYNLFNKFVIEQSKKVDTSKFKNEFAITDASSFVTGAIKLSVQKTSGNSSIDSLRFVFEDESGYSYTENVDSNLPQLLETRSYFFSPNIKFGKLKKILVYPVIEGKEGISSSIGAGNIFNIPSGVVSYWKLDRDLTDSISKHDGIIKGDASFSVDSGKSALYFNSGSVDFGNNLDLNLDRYFTLVFSIKTNSKNKMILIKGKDNYNYFVGINNNGKLNFTYLLGGFLKSKESNSIISDNNWHQIIITNLALYVDGKSDLILDINDKIDSNNENLILGDGLNGFVSQMFLFNRSIDRNQASGLYNSFM